MNDLKEQIREEIEAEALAGLFSDYMKEEGQSAVQACETGETEPPVVLTKRQDEQIIRHMAWEICPPKRLTKKRLLIAAMIAALLCAVQASAIPSLLRNYFVTYQKHSVDFSENAQPAGSYGIYAGVPAPAYVPPGFHESASSAKDGLTELTYQNHHQIIRYLIYENPSSVRLDLEKASTVEKVEINGQPGVYLIKDGCQTLFWGKTPAYELIAYKLDKAELFRMAESVDFTPEKQVK